MKKSLILFLIVALLYNKSNAQTCNVADNIHQLSSNAVTVNSSNLGQSFKVSCNGTIKSIRVWTNKVTQNINGVLRVYNGTFSGFAQNLNLPILHTQNFSWNKSSSTVMHTIELSKPISVVSGNDYMFMFHGTNEDNSAFLYQNNKQTYTAGELKEKDGDFWFSDTDDDLKFQVNYTDVIPPTANCKNATIYLDTNGEATLTFSQVNNGSSGGVVGHELSKEKFTCKDLGENRVILTVQDAGLNQDNCEATITVVDNLPPINTNCPSDINVIGCKGVEVNYEIPTFTDNTENECPLVIERIQGLESGASFPFGETMITYRATDSAGLSTDCTFKITVSDDSFPIITGIPEDETIYLKNECKGSIAPYNVQVIDNCEGVVLTQVSGISGTGPFPVGVTTNTYKAIDEAGNVTTKSFTVTVIDNQVPNVSCQDVNLVLDANGVGTVTMDQINNGSFDNCNITSLSLSTMKFKGETSTSDETDLLLGNSSKYYVKNYSFVAPVTGQYEFMYTGTSTDAFGIIMSLWSDVPVRNSGAFSTREEYVGFTSRNSEGAVMNGTKYYNLIAGKTYYFDMTSNVGGNTVTFDGDIIINETDLDFSCNPGIYPLELIIKDNNNNINSCTAKITVTKPTLTFENCPENQIISVDENQCTANIIFSTPTITNASCGAQIKQTAGLPSGSDFPLGENYIEFTATNDLGESVSCSFILKVEDTEKPVVNHLGNIVVNNSVIGEGTVVTYDMPFTDNCTEAANLTIIQLAGLPSGSVYPIGTTFNKFEATDASGNTSVCSFYVTVKDTFTPEISCKNYTVDIVNKTTIAPNDFNNGTTDNSGNINFGFLTKTFSGELTTNSLTDIYAERGGDIHYVAVYPFIVTESGDYSFNISGTTSYVNSNEFYFSLYEQRPVLMTGESIESSPGYIDQSFTTYNYHDDGEINSGIGEYRLLKDKIYFAQISTKNTEGTGSFRFTVNQEIITTEAVLNLNCNDIGTSRQTLYAFDDSGNMATCESMLTVENSEAAVVTCNKAYVPQAIIDENEGKIYPNNLNDGSSVGFLGFSTNNLEENITTQAPTISDISGNVYYYKKMVFIPTAEEKSQITLSSNKPTQLIILDRDIDSESINFNEVITELTASENDKNSVDVNLEVNKVYYGYFLVNKTTSLVTPAKFTFNKEGLPITTTLASIVPNGCETTQELIAFTGCGSNASCNVPITTDLCFTDAFITTWKTDKVNDIIKIYTNASTYTYNYDILWGDGTIDKNVTGDITHQYATPGEYTVKIIGDFPHLMQTDSPQFPFVNWLNAAKLQEINQWGNIKWKSMDSAFKGCSNMTLEAVDIPDLSLVNATNYMFSRCTFFTGKANMNNWDMSTIKTMNGMFEEAPFFNANIGNWDVSNVTNMFGVFLVASSFNQDISNWNVGNVTNMRSMFHLAKKFNQNISNWNVEKVEVMANMFWGASNFNQNIGGWNVEKVKDMTGVFYNASSFNQDISSWNVSNVLTMNTMFRNATSFNANIGNWNVSKVTNTYEMFGGATSFNQNLEHWDISSLKDASFMFSGMELSVDNYDSLLKGWSTLTEDESQIPSNILFSGGISTYCKGAAARNVLSTTYNWKVTDAGLQANCNNVSVSLKVYLQGASLNPKVGEELLMRDDLRVNNQIPSTSPYIDEVTIDTDVLTVTGTDAIVDWVFVELRDKENSSILKASQSALLQRDGNVVGVDGVSALNFNVLPGEYHIVIKHRNHIDVMSATSIALTQATAQLDFSLNILNVLGGANTLTALSNGLYAMYSGDYDKNGQIQNIDINAVISTLGSSGYHNADMDMNGQVQNSDINNIINPNIGKGKQF